MPKQVWKIDQFHGGISNSSDPRDIADNELVSATDIMVDNIGRIRSIGSSDDHDAKTNFPDLDITAGYGLCAFNHDRKYAHLGEHLAEPDFLTHAKWTVTDDITDTTGKLLFTYGGGVLEGTATQAYGERAEAGINNIGYVFTYTVTVTTAPTNFELTLTGFSSSTVVCPVTAGRHSVTFTSASDAATSDFVLTATDDVGGITDAGVFSIDDVSLMVYDAPLTGENYLAVADDESDDAAIYLYSNSGGWGSGQKITLTEGGASGGEYISTEANRLEVGLGSWNWEEYSPNTTLDTFDRYYATMLINGTTSTEKEGGQLSTDYLFSLNIGTTYTVQATFGSDVVMDGGKFELCGVESSSFSLDGSGWQVISKEITLTTNVGYLRVFFENNVGTDWYVRDISIQINATSSNFQPCFYVADGNLRVVDGNFTNTNRSQWLGYVKRNANGAHSCDQWINEDQIVPRPAMGNTIEQTNVVGWTSAAYGSVGPKSGSVKLATEFTSASPNQIGTWDTTHTSDTIVGTATYDGGAKTEVEITGHGYQNGQIVKFVLNSSVTDGTYTVESATTDKFVVADSYTSGTDDDGTCTLAVGYRLYASYVYDNGQETATTMLHADGVFQSLFPSKDRLKGSLEIGTSGDLISRRISGLNIYWDHETDHANNKYLLLEVNLEKGIREVGAVSWTDWTYHPNTTNPYMVAIFDIPDPLAIISYRAQTGNDDGDTTDARFKTAVLANRRIYAGNIYQDGVVYGDRIIKSSVNKFDTFPIDNQLEVSINDGDEIVKLEEYADRLLQFKVNKMHIINIAQEVEFLEETFTHKGISNPGAVCKTDFGIAWVNEFGCYLYDGKTVHNLLEKKGMKKISQSTWGAFIGSSSLIGYMPKDRQLMVIDDATDSVDIGNSGNIFIYDLATQSWVQGFERFPASNILKTNLITDWNGDMVCANSSSQKTSKWVTTSATTTTISFKTKDMDFGQPAQRKKIYKVYISYKGDGSAVTVAYQSNGDTDAGSPFYRTTADGSSDGTNSDTTPLLNVGTDDWVPAELKPVSSINNVYSFQLIFDGTAAADFEINDISIIYRLKGLK